MKRPPSVVVAVGLAGSVLAAGSSAAAQAATATPVFAVGGDRSSSANLLVSQTVRFRVVQDGTSASVRTSGGRTFVGFAIVESGGRFVAGSVSPADFALGGKPLLVRLGPPQEVVTLKPGRYRVTFLGDASGRISFPLISGPRSGISVVGKTPVDVVAAWSRLPNRVPGSTDAVSLPFSEVTLSAISRPGNWTSLSTVNVAQGPQDDHAWLCMRPRGSAECSLIDHDFGVQSSNLGTGESAAVAEASFPPGSLKGGQYDAGVGWRNIGTRSRQAAFVITFRP